jgi:hypothetical protein
MQRQPDDLGPVMVWTSVFAPPHTAKYLLLKYRTKSGTIQSKMPGKSSDLPFCISADELHIVADESLM